MQIQNDVVFKLTKREALILAKYLPDSLEAEDENEDFLAKMKEQLCETMGVNSWDLYHLHTK